MSEPEPRITIASAVVVPSQISPVSPTLKRRDSDFNDSTASSSEPNAKRSRLNASTDDRGRGRRLFGAVLGNLGRSTTDNKASRKRAEVDAKMQEKRRIREEEVRADERKREMEKSANKKEFAEKAGRLRRHNDRSMAHFLVTKAKPRLYYLPWKLTDSQERTIEDQVAKSLRNKSPSPQPQNSPTNKRDSIEQEEIKKDHNNDDDGDTSMKGDDSGDEKNNDEHQKKDANINIKSEKGTLSMDIDTQTADNDDDDADKGTAVVDKEPPKDDDAKDEDSIEETKVSLKDDDEVVEY